MARIAHIAFGFAVAMLLAGCSREAEPQAGDSLYWNPPDQLGAEWMPWAFEWLFLQVSADPVVYISTDEDISSFRLPSEEYVPHEQIVIIPSTLDDILPRILVFQGKQDAVKRKAVVMIGGDDRAPCSSVLKAIDCAKRARVSNIFLESFWRPSGTAFFHNYLDDGYSFYIKYFEFPSGFKPSDELARNIATITVTKETFQWGSTSVTVEELIEELDGFASKTDSKKVLLVIRVDPDAPFPALRYVLGRAHRARIKNVMITQK